VGEPDFRFRPPHCRLSIECYGHPDRFFVPALLERLSEDAYRRERFNGKEAERVHFDAVVLRAVAARLERLSGDTILKTTYTKLWNEVELYELRRDRLQINQQLARSFAKRLATLNVQIAKERSALDACGDRKALQASVAFDLAGHEAEANSLLRELDEANSKIEELEQKLAGEAHAKLENKAPRLGVKR
jgi:hypothetical protein